MPMVTVMKMAMTTQCIKEVTVQCSPRRGLHLDTGNAPPLHSLHYTALHMHQCKLHCTFALHCTYTVGLYCITTTTKLTILKVPLVCLALIHWTGRSKVQVEFNKKLFKFNCKRDGQLHSAHNIHIRCILMVLCAKTGRILGQKLKIERQSSS